MRILVTNDDGIHAHGLKIAEKIAHDLTDDVFVVAPEYEQSGVAHSLSLNDPLRLREISPRTSTCCLNLRPTRTSSRLLFAADWRQETWWRGR